MDFLKGTVTKIEHQYSDRSCFSGNSVKCAEEPPHPRPGLPVPQFGPEEAVYGAGEAVYGPENVVDNPGEVV